jgi:hypothetical protein
MTRVGSQRHIKKYCLNENKSNIQFLLISSPTNVTFQPEHLTYMSLWHKVHKNVFGVCILLNFDFKSTIKTVVFLLLKNYIMGTNT